MCQHTHSVARLKWTRAINETPMTPTDEQLLAMIRASKRTADPVGDFLAAWAVMFGVLLGAMWVEIALGVIRLP